MGWRRVGQQWAGMRRTGGHPPRLPAPFIARASMRACARGPKKARGAARSAGCDDKSLGSSLFGGVSSHGYLSRVRPRDNHHIIVTRKTTHCNPAVILKRWVPTASFWPSWPSWQCAKRGPTRMPIRRQRCVAEGRGQRPGKWVHCGARAWNGASALVVAHPGPARRQHRSLCACARPYQQCMRVYFLANAAMRA